MSHGSCQFKGVRYDLETHLRGIKISGVTKSGPLSSKIKSRNRYNLWFMIYNLCQNDEFSRIKDGFSPKFTKRYELLSHN